MPLQDITNTLGNASSSKKNAQKRHKINSKTDKTNEVENRDELNTKQPLVKEMIERQIAQVHSVIKKETELCFSGPGEVLEGNLKRKRERKSPKEFIIGTESLKQKTDDATPKTVSPYFGELTTGSIQKILDFFSNGAPEELRMNEKSSFLDIGSGFGRCVFFASIMLYPRKAVGIEYVLHRHIKALEILENLKPKIPSLENVVLDQGDATAKSKADVLNQSHIYCYDKAFNETTHEALMKALKKANFKIFACFSNIQKLNKFGCSSWLEPFHNLKVNTTGGQSFTIHFYKKIVED